MPIIISFPIHPDKIQNGSAKKVKGDIEDIIIQGYRRSLSDWLVICQKSVAEYRDLLDEGYPIRQAIIHGLPRLRPHQVDADITFQPMDTKLLPPSLPQLQIRRARIEAWLAKFNKELDDRQRTFLSYRLLTECYEAWKQHKPWKPTYASLFPHCEVLKPTPEELHLAASISRCHLLERTEAGYFPKKRLEEYFSPLTKKKQTAIHIWYPKISAIRLPDTTLLTLSRIAYHIKIHRSLIRSSWMSRGVTVKGPIPLSEWKELAKRVDSQVSCKLTKGKFFNRRR